ncbi:unnamed protein product [Aureobasidium mustum]|uniref:BTB domain-containing protein n=1 Tax=Aureobasidium mustum TaxID=2773714 RepID=A0A9N8JJ38_9PEZI|nr:unnamed protein product [Aureobasidium mustum]
MASQHREDYVLIEIHEDTKLYTFQFLKDVICSVSPFFQKAFQGYFLESRTKVIDISDVAVENFRIFAKWVTTGQLEQQPLDIMLELYVMADRLDIPTFRGAIIDNLTSYHCFKFDFEVPDTLLIVFMMENIPKSLPIHALLATAVARVLYHKPEGLEYLPYGFAVRVQNYLDKPYGICDACLDHDQDHDHDGETHNIADNCEHFFNQPSDFDPHRYQEG